MNSCGWHQKLMCWKGSIKTANKLYNAHFRDFLRVMWIKAIFRKKVSVYLVSRSLAVLLMTRLLRLVFCFQLICTEVIENLGISQIQFFGPNSSRIKIRLFVRLCILEVASQGAYTCCFASKSCFLSGLHFLSKCNFHFMYILSLFYSSCCP